MVIYFYSQTEAYSELSNFAPFGVEMDAEWWPTVEHYFQAQKFHDLEHRARIRRAAKPKDAKSLGRSRAVPLRSDWEETKDEIMYLAVRRKFLTHAGPREILLNTADEELVENAPMDAYWGCGPDGNGLNKLGKILMRVRQELRSSRRE